MRKDRFTKGEHVICKNSFGHELHLTEGRSYEIKELRRTEHNLGITVQDDIGLPFEFCSSRFATTANEPKGKNVKQKRIETGSLVRCTKDTVGGQKILITKGKCYEVVDLWISATSWGVYVMNDRGEVEMYSSKRFELVEDVLQISANSLHKAHSAMKLLQTCLQEPYSCDGQQITPKVPAAFCDALCEIQDALEAMEIV